MYSLVKNKAIDHNRGKYNTAKKIANVVGKKPITETGLSLEDKITINRLHRRINKILVKCNSYDKTLYNLYTGADRPTMRELSKTTGLSLSTISERIKKVRDLIESHTQFICQGIENPQESWQTLTPRPDRYFWWMNAQYNGNMPEKTWIKQYNP